jgi:hypothetical protein
MSVLTTATRATASAGGQVLRAATGLVTARPASKPLHPRGAVVRGVLRRSGSDPAAGAAWLDEPGEDRVLVRRSRAVGLPSPVPDIHGLAIRVPVVGGWHGDLLLASTGLGRLTRFTLTAGRSPQARPMTTLLPYRTPVGPVLLAAVLRDERTVDLAWAVGAGEWHGFGELTLEQEPVDAADEPVSFDPVLNRLPGLEPYDWVRRLREPSYATARQSRRS